MPKKHRASEGEATTAASPDSPPAVTPTKAAYSHAGELISEMVKRDSEEMQAFFGAAPVASAERMGRPIGSFNVPIIDPAMINVSDRDLTIAGFNITRALTEKGWLAVKVLTSGVVVVLTPKRNGELSGESKEGATARALDAFRAAVMEAR